MSIAWIIFLSLLNLNSSQSAVLCKRGPEAAALLPQFSGVQTNLPSNSAKDPCTGSAIVQAFQYQCSPVDAVTENTQKFLKNITKQARKACEEHCRSRARGCIGEFEEPQRCGLFIYQKEALEAGREVAQCPSNCEGQAFSYCSIYHAGYTSMDKSLFTGKEPNCTCHWKGRKSGTK